MATTTNYGWGTPDDTDLVKDGALAIRDLGQDIDTTTKALNPETTTGDIAYRSATANTNTRLALGTAGQVLTVNSGATAPEWTTPAGGGGKVLQVINTLKSDTFTTTSSSFVNVTGLSATITPTRADSQVLVMVTISGIGTDVSGSAATGYVILRDSTQIAVNTGLTADFTGLLSIRDLGATTSATFGHSTNFLDSPSTTAATTYKIQAKASAGNLYINRDGDNFSGSVSSITLFEIGA